jgi:hypothetical protein
MSPKLSRKVSFQALAETENCRFSFNHESRIFLSLLIETPLIEPKQCQTSERIFP